MVGNTIPKSVSDAITRRMTHFQKILRSARERDINESNTVTIVTDILAEVFGYDKYTEITSEQAIRGTFCDLAVQIDNKTHYLLEVKAIGLTLKENHLRQAVNYGANHGVSWVVLTNGIHWQVYRIKFDKPITHEFVYEFDFTSLSARKTADREMLYRLCRAGITKSALGSFHERSQTINRFVLSQLIQSDAVVYLLRRELRRLLPASRVSLAGD